jgi:phosphoglycerol transferase MdoB-like AlkP superfamily enzyme
MIKSMFFLSLIHSPNSAQINILKMYFAPPPFITQTAFIILLLSPAFLFKNKGRLIYYVSVNVAITLLLIGDLWYFRVSGNYLSIRYIFEQQLFNPLNRSMAVFYPVDILFFVDFILLFKKANEQHILKTAKRNIRAFSFAVVLSIMYISSSYYLLDKLNITNGIMLLFRTCWTPVQTMSNLSPIGYHGFDIYKTLVQDKRLSLTEKDEQDIKSWFQSNKEKLPDNDYNSIFKGKNLIAIQVESLENFVIGQKIYGQEITPNLNRLLKNSLYFSNIYEQNNGGTSSDADLMINTSLLPVRERMTFFRFPDTEYNSLPKLLGDIGYETFSTHAEYGGNYAWTEVHKASLKFQSSWDIFSYNVDETIRGELTDGSLFTQVEPKLNTLKQPFYSSIVTLTSHGPFDMPEKLNYLKLSNELEDTILGDYFQSVRYVDSEIGKFLDKLQRSGLLDNSVIMIYGDHAGVNKFYKDKLENINLEGDWWKEEEKKIPLIIYNPNAPSVNIETLGGHIDIMPTIAYLLGIEENKFINTAMGKILVKTNKDFTVLNYGRIIGNPSEQQKEHLLKTIEISDKIIQGNYFKNSTR